jgi:hypothetical protein
MSNLRPYFSEDIINILKGISYAAGTGISPSEEYKQGFMDCVISMCKAFGISLKEIKSE